MYERTPRHRRPRTGLPRGARAVAIGSASALAASLAVVVAATPAAAAVTLAVSPTGSDANTCTSALPCKSVQKAINVGSLFVTPVDVTINVAAGTYTENALPAPATASTPARW